MVGGADHTRRTAVMEIRRFPTTPHRSNIARTIGTTHTITQPRTDLSRRSCASVADQADAERRRMFWLWWKTLSGSYVVFTSTSRS